MEKLGFRNACLSATLNFKFLREGEYPCPFPPKIK